MRQITMAARKLRGPRACVLAAATLLASIAGPVAAAPGNLEGFLDLRWGDSETSATATLNRHFRFHSKADGYRTFTGTVGGYPASWVHAYAKRDQVYGVRVVLGTPAGKDPFALHRDVAETLRKHYGPHTNASFVRGDQGQGDYDDLAQNANQTPAKQAAYDQLVKAGGGAYGTNWYFDDGNAITLRLQQFDKGRPPMVSIDYWSVKTQQALEASDAGEL